MEEEIAHAQLIARVLETHDVVGVAGDALGEFAGWEDVLAQEEDSDVLMMRVFGEEIEHTFVVASFLHEIVQYQDTSFLLGKPHGQEFRIGNAFVKMHALLFHALEPILPGPITVVDAFGRGLEEVGVIHQQFSSEHRLNAARRAHYHQAGGCVKPSYITLVHRKKKLRSGEARLPLSQAREPMIIRLSCTQRLDLTFFKKGDLTRIRTSDLWVMSLMH